MDDNDDRATEEVRSACQDLLTRFGLLPLANLRPHALDSHTRKLAHLIRIRLLDPDLIFLDDPLEELQGSDRVDIEGWIRAWAEDPGRILLATTEEEDAELPGIKRRVKLQDGRLEGFP